MAAEGGGSGEARDSGSSWIVAPDSGGVHTKQTTA